MKISEIPLVLLAAGNSTRMGRPKGLLQFRERPWIVAQIEAFQAAGGRRVIVVLGYHAQEYLKAFANLNLGIEMSYALSENPERGSFSSLLTGLQASAGNAAFVLPIDVPAPTPSVWRALAQSTSAAVTLPTWNQRGGHPILVSQEFSSELQKYDPTSAESRLDFIIRKLPIQGVHRVPVDDPNVVINLNTIEDCRRFSAEFAL